MKCPLLTLGSLDEETEKYTGGVPCAQEECAWWDEPVKRCLWLNVSEKLSFIYLELNDIAIKMPYLEQFKRP